MWTLTWPIFDERYEGTTVVSTPDYWDSLIVVLIILLAVSAALYSSLGRKGRSQALQLITLRPGTIRSISEHAPGGWTLFAGIVLGSVLAGILAMLLDVQSTGGAASVSLFWAGAARYSVYVLVLYLLSLLLQIWISYSFGESFEFRLWIFNYLLLSVLWLGTLALPLLLALTLPGSKAVPVVGGLLYLAYRAWVVWRGTAVISRVKRHPFHIIWYLCGCELLPLLFLGNIIVGR